MEEKQVKNSKIGLLEEFFGITLPDFKMHVCSREIESEAKKENGVLVAAKWKALDGIVLPPELEIYLPQEGMTPQQGLAQLEICSSVARGGENDSYKIYDQATMMKFHFVAIQNCLCLANQDCENWDARQKPSEEDTYLDGVKKEIWVLLQAFSREASLSFYLKIIGPLFLRVLLENNGSLNIGTEMETGKGRKKVYYNTISELLFLGYNLSYVNHNDLNKYVQEILGYQCREVTEKILLLRD